MTTAQSSLHHVFLSEAVSPQEEGILSFFPEVSHSGCDLALPAELLSRSGICKAIYVQKNSDSKI